MKFIEPLVERLSHLSLKIQNPFNPNLWILADVSFLLSNFAIPCLLNFYREGNTKFSEKHDKLSNLNVKLIYTNQIKKRCTYLLSKKKDADQITAETIMDKVLSDRFFIEKMGNANKVTTKMYYDFQDSDKKDEDTYHISTANIYGIPIVTNEKKRIKQWRDNCENQVVLNIKFWEFIDRMNEDKINGRKLISEFNKEFSVKKVV